MMPCSAYRTLMLDHLYGLLDPAEAADVETHLSGCSDCAAAQVQARGQQGLIARAAKVEFPLVRFTPPRESEPVLASPAVRSIEARPASRSFARRAASWAVAASVLVAVSIAAAAVGVRLERAELTRSAATTASARTNEAKLALEQLNRDMASVRIGAKGRVDGAERKRDTALTEWVAAEKAAGDTKVAVRVTKPAALQPGAPNTFVLSVMDGGANLPAEPIFAEVRDQNGKTVYSAQFDHVQQGPHGLFRLPADIWHGLKPDDELFLAIVLRDAGTGKSIDLQEPMRLFGPVYTTMLVTDRTDYRAGEPVYFRSLTLDRVTFRPPHREQHLKYELSRVGPGGASVGVVQGSTGLAHFVAGGNLAPTLGADGVPLRGVGCGAIQLPPTLEAGDYVLTLTELRQDNGLPPAMAVPATRTIRIHNGPAESYQKQIGFGAAGYSPGQVVEGWTELKQQDQPVVGMAITLLAVDGSGRELTIPRTSPSTGPDGRAQFRIQLPAVLPPGDVRVKVTFHPKVGTAFEVAERVPVVGRNLHVEFFPEGGVMVAGVENRVYVRATTPAGKPVDLRGTITDGEQVVARIETPTDANEPGVNRGLGSFAFTPKPQARYWLKLEAPTGAYEPPLDNLPNLGALRPPRTGFLLPAVQPGGVVMAVRDPVTEVDQPIRVGLHSVGKDRSLIVGAYIRGRLADSRRIALASGSSGVVELLKDSPAVGRGGVVRITVFEEEAANDLVPVAERLAYRKPAESLNFTLGANGGPLGASPRGFAPGTPIDLSIRAFDEHGRPTAAAIYAKVTNAGGTVAAKERLLTSQFLVAGEVQNPDDLEYADFLLSTDPRAAAALDRVLATQGWRRFAEQAQPKPQPLGARAAPPAAPERLGLLHGSNPVTVDPTQARQAKAFDEKFPQYEKATRDLAQARAAKEAVDADHSGDAKLRELTTAYDDSRERLVDWTDKAEGAAEAVTAVNRWKWPAVGALLAAAIGCAAFAGVRRAGASRAVPLVLASVALFGLAAYLGTAVSPPEPITFEQVNLEPAEPTAPFNAVPEAGVPPKSAPNVAVPPKLNDRQKGKVLAIKSPEAKMMAAPRSVGVEQKISDDLLRANARRLTLTAKAAKVPAEMKDDSAAVAKQFAQDRDEEAAKKLQAFPAADAPAAERVRKAIVRPAPLVVREYASPRPASTAAADGPDTLLWKPIIVLPTDGQTTLQFHLGASPAGYEVIVAGHTPDGRIGAVRGLLPVEAGK